MVGMTMQFSCGHWATNSEDIGIPVALKRQDIDRDGWKNVIHYATYCERCYEEAVADHEVAMTEEEEMNWLRGDV
jgi:acyl-CoA thioesterase FadM